MIANKAKHDIAQAVITRNVLIQIKAKSPNLFAKIQRDYQEALKVDSNFNPIKSLIEVLES